MKEKAFLVDWQKYHKWTNNEDFLFAILMALSEKRSKLYHECYLKMKKCNSKPSLSKLKDLNLKDNFHFKRIIMECKI